MSLSWTMCTCMTVLSLYIGGCQAAVGDACPVGNECTVTGETCSGGACVCDTTTHYQSGSSCVTRLDPGVTCPVSPTNACKDNSVCTLISQCTCNQGYYDSDGPSTNNGICTPSKMFTRKY
ncbi:uncharacterized protein LOC110453299 [Mizuhopecten yessoensis]|uniref:uncharacterized protein LOC110453299 n=1 Tax=Mizuhopecten yessoensis TaxID=6573 RepID=UPI000B4578A8|nr:uncharacterized protein LOC110453299 [Mizuhopecten yessoensis]